MFLCFCIFHKFMPANIQTYAFVYITYVYEEIAKKEDGDDFQRRRVQFWNWNNEILLIGTSVLWNTLNCVTLLYLCSIVGKW